YADFRVKDSTRVYGVKRMSIISLKDAFAEIRDKLENLDEAKLRRYEAVYRKLRDLEDYALALGVQLDPPGFGTLQPPRPKLPKGLSVTDVMAGRQRPDVVSLVRGPQVATVARFFATAHNIGVMERLRDLPALRHLLEEARSFEGWRDLRTYLGVLGEYAPALSMEQKELALEFFFDLLGHGDDDIRYHAANRIGDLLALGEDFWRKDLPEGVAAEGDDWVLTQLDKVMALLERAGTEAEEDMGPTETVLYAIPIVVRRLVSRARGRIRDDALDRILARLEARVGDDRPLVALYACECCEVLAPHARPSDHERMAALAEARARHATVNARLMAWRALLALARERQDAAVRQSARTAVRRLVGTLAEDALVAELFLLEELSTALDLPEAAARCSEALGQRRDAIQTVMLRNLKSRVGWVEKKVNCDYLVAVALSGVARSTDSGAYFANEVAGHLANLLKVSRVEGTRFHAGRSLLRLLPALTVTQRNDLAVELLRALQLDAESVTRYIPRFLGSVVASLPDQEFLEILDDVEADLRRGNEPLQRLLLQTADWILLSLGEERLEGGVMRRLAGMFLGALAETRSSTVHEGYAEIAMVLERLTYDGTRDRRLPLFLQLVTKKLLTLVTHRPADRGRFFLIASALNHLDRAIERERRRLRLPARPTVALVPGTFDPFTLAHAEVVSRLLSHADEVLIQVDDYSWNKHAQPREVRKELAWMALGPVPDAFLAPFEPPVNLRNAESVATVRRALGGRDPVLVVGSDVLDAASAYRSPDSHLWDIPHVVVVREDWTSKAWEEKLGWFRARVQVARLPHHARTVSSTSVRAALDRGEHLAHLCDPLVARTLAERQLYVNYPSKKEPVRPPRLSLRTHAGRVALHSSLQPVLGLEATPTTGRWSGRPRETSLLVSREGGRPLAALSWHEATAAALPVTLGEERLAEAPQRSLVGRGALIDTVAAADRRDGETFSRLLSMVMGRWLDAGMQFAVAGLPGGEGVEALWRAMESAGAKWLLDTAETGPGDTRWASVDLTDPLLLVWDMEAVLQPPYAAALETQAAMAGAHDELARFFADRRPGHALFHLHERETKRALVEGARERLAADRGRREWVVLGLGRQFHRDVIGGCPTIALDLERFLTPQGYDAGVLPSVGSPALEMQLHTARELGRDALVLVPFLESPEPIVQLRAAARTAGVALREVLVGVTSAAVHATLHLQGIPHRCSVIVPRWRGVVRESALAPYLGGWSILGRDPFDSGSLLPSLNDCLPYHHPHPLGLEGEDALDFSRLALDLTRTLFLKLEELFRQREGRLLSLRELGFVVRTPRCPPFPQGFVPPRERVPSALLAEDLESLARLHPESHLAHRERWRAE
ncbi:MAG: adenylyltransferase/cytidyltransferase family protein, partial [Acidobacteriota bacterium]